MGQRQTVSFVYGAEMSVLVIPLLVWLSPGFPVGAFAFSQGLEMAIETGAVHDATSLRVWLEDLVAHGSARADAALLAAAWHARDDARMVALNELALALAPSSERHLESSAQGNAFLAAVTAAWPAPGLGRFLAALGGRDAAYSIAVGIAAAAHNIALRPTLEAFSLAACANLVSAAVRLGPIGQTQAQAVIAARCPAIAALAVWAETSTDADFGTAAWYADVASMRHETQYSRLFRS